MSKFSYSEELVADFELALRNAGMTDIVTSTLPKFYRGNVPSNNNDKISLRYQVTDRIGRYADNMYNTVEMWINATIFINSLDGYYDTDYKSLIDKIETECLLLGYEMLIGTETNESNTSDPDSVTYMLDLEFKKRR